MQSIRRFQNFSEPLVRAPKFHHYEIPPTPIRIVPQINNSSETIELPNEIWVTRVVQATIETLHGGRSVSQLRNVMGPKVLKQLQARREVVSRVRKGILPSVNGVKFWPISPNKIEATAICKSETHFFPIALRLEKQATTWTVMACEIGPY